jgi:hypothetical protein
MLQIDAQNFGVLRDFHLHDEGKFSIVVGYNESGKTTLAQLPNYAFTGVAKGYRGKATKKLTSHGETRHSVTVRVGDKLSARRTTTTGDSPRQVAQHLGIPLDVLPLLFDAKMVGDGGNKYMKAFLQGAGQQRHDALAEFINDQSVRPFIEHAHAAGKTETKQIIKYCEDMRAAQKVPTAPVRPEGVAPSNDDLIAAGRWLEDARQQEQQAKSYRSAVREKIHNLNHVITYLASMVNFEAAQKEASKGDPLGERRGHLAKVTGIDTLTLANMAGLLQKVGYEDTAADLHNTKKHIESLIEDCVRELESNPPPKPLPPTPQLAQSAFDLYNTLKGEDRCNIAHLQNELLEMQKIEVKATEDTDAAEREVVRANDNLATLQQRRGAWEAYNKAEAEHEDNVIRMKDQWSRWDYAAKAIAQNEEEFLKKTGDRFGELVSQFSVDLLRGRKVIINREEGIHLGNTPISDCSLSTQWRIEVSVMAAIAIILKSPLLVIDGVDILDIHNRSAMLTFLRQKIVPRFEHVLVTATARGTLEEEQQLPAGVTDTTKWVLKSGQVYPMAQEKAVAPPPPPPPPPPPGVGQPSMP